MYFRLSAQIKQYNYRYKKNFFSFKVWSICTSDGAGVWFEPYCGRDTHIEDFGLGQGPNVVLALVDFARLGPGTEIFFDNLFTSFPLLDRLSEMQIGGTGTVRQNRLHRVPVISKKQLENKNVDRGTSEVLYNGDQTLVAWKDSKAVYVASNMHSGSADNTCKRFDRAKKKSVQVRYWYCNTVKVSFYFYISFIFPLFLLPPCMYIHFPTFLLHFL